MDHRGDHDNECETDLLLAFLAEHGARFPKLRYPVLNRDGVRSVFATETIAPGEYLLEIPKRLLMTPDAARVAHVELRNDPYFLANDRLSLAVLLYSERMKGKDSFWYPYIATLPRHSSAATDWSFEQLAELQDENLVRRVEELRADNKRDFLECRKRLPALITSRELFLWSLFIVDSRAFGRRLAQLSLVPLADALNHSNVGIKYRMMMNDSNVIVDGKVKRKDGEEGRFVMWYTTAASRGGEEVFNSYGRLGNEDLITHYGFALSETNEWDCVLANFSVKQDHTLASMKRQLVRRGGLEDPLVVGFRHSFQEADLRLVLRFFRISEASSEEMAMWERASDGSREYFRRAVEVPLTLEHEVRAVDAAREELERILKLAFPTTLEEDERELNASRDFVQISALRYRISRKRILHKALRFYEELLRRIRLVERHHPRLTPNSTLDELRAKYPGIYAECARGVYYPNGESQVGLPPPPPPR